MMVLVLAHQHQKTVCLINVHNNLIVQPQLVVVLELVLADSQQLVVMDTAQETKVTVTTKIITQA